MGGALTSPVVADGRLLFGETDHHAIARARDEAELVVRLEAGRLAQVAVRDAVERLDERDRGARQLAGEALPNVLLIAKRYHDAPPWQ